MIPVMKRKVSDLDPSVIVVSAKTRDVRERETVDTQKILFGH